MSPIPPAGSTAPTAAGATVSATSAKTDQNMFLQLLVAQLKNQDPTAPMDSTTFVTQLAQFQQLEATTNMGQDVSGIRSDTDQFLTDATGAAATGSTNSTTQP